MKVGLESRRGRGREESADRRTRDREAAGCDGGEDSRGLRPAKFLFGVIIDGLLQFFAGCLEAFEVPPVCIVFNLEQIVNPLLDFEKFFQLIIHIVFRLFGVSLECQQTIQVIFQVVQIRDNRVTA